MKRTASRRHRTAGTAGGHHRVSEVPAARKRAAGDYLVREEQIPVPHVKPGTAGNEIVWALPSSGRLLQMLRNPCYAGAFAYGKTAGRTVIEQGRARQGTRYRKPKSECKVLLTDHHSGYISWEEYVQNQQQIDANAMSGDGEGSGAAKTGAALLSGLLRCGQCGRKLQVVYSGNKGRVPRYICRGDRGDRGHARCQTVGSLRLDRAIVRCVLDAIQPVGIEAAINVAASTRAEDDAKKASLELASNARDTKRIEHGASSTL